MKKRWGNTTMPQVRIVAIVERYYSYGARRDMWSPKASLSSSYQRPALMTISDAEGSTFEFVEQNNIL